MVINCNGSFTSSLEGTANPATRRRSPRNFHTPSLLLAKSSRFRALCYLQHCKMRLPLSTWLQRQFSVSIDFSHLLVSLFPDHQSNYQIDHKNWYQSEYESKYLILKVKFMFGESCRFYAPAWHNPILITELSTYRTSPAFIVIFEINIYFIDKNRANF